jgi:DNA-binding GntR family transcriptional regulator
VSTIADVVSRQLVQEIVAGTIRPGERLEEQVLAEKFGVSRSPIRDALRQLGGTGLVEIRPNRSAIVVDLRVEQVQDMYEALGNLEGLCAKFCSQRMTVLERKQLETLHEKSRLAVRKKDKTAYAELNDQFHDLIHRGSHNATLQSISQELRQRLAPFRKPAFFHGSKRLLDSWEEHDAVVAAILASNSEQASASMAKHLVNSSLNIVSYVEEIRAHPPAASAATTVSSATKVPAKRARARR